MPNRSNINKHPLVNKDLTVLEWKRNFSTEYLSLDDKKNAKALFDIVGNRINVLANAIDYKYNNIVGVLYGAMIKQMLNGGGDFVQQGDIVALFIIWVRNGNALELAITPVKSNGKPTGTIQFPAPGTLFNLLKLNQAFPLINIKSKLLIDALGFVAEPSHTTQTIEFQPGIIPLGTIGQQFFVLVVPSGNAITPCAYAPPCPPFCYSQII